MASTEELYRQLDEAEARMRATESQMGRFMAIQPRLAELVGRADTADGLVHVEWTSAGVSALELDPRAMRLPSADLAAAVLEGIRAAGQDHRAQARDLIAEAGLAVPTEAPSPDALRSQMTQLREQTMDAGRRAAADLDEAVRRRREIEERTRG